MLPFFFVLIPSVKTNRLPYLKEWGSFFFGSVLRSDGEVSGIGGRPAGLFGEVSADAFLDEGEGVSALF